jgi:hypothetical protein
LIVKHIGNNKEEHNDVEIDKRMPVEVINYADK